MPDDLFAAAHDTGCKRFIKIPPHWMVSAVFGGPNECYRYFLAHSWGKDHGPAAVFAMMNPSGADVTVADSTVWRTAKIAQRMGFCRQIIINACAYRATNPKTLLGVHDPVGPKNAYHIEELCKDAGVLIVAHGLLPPKLRHHAEAMVDIMRQSGKPLHILGLTKDGTPVHPLVRGKNALPANAVAHAWAPGA